MDVRPAIKILSPRADSILMLRPTLTYVRSKSRLPKSTRNEPNLDRVASGLSACLPGCMRRGYGYAMQAGARERPMRSERSFANIARNFQSQLWGRRIFAKPSTSMTSPISDLWRIMSPIKKQIRIIWTFLQTPSFLDVCVFNIMAPSGVVKNSSASWWISCNIHA